MGGPPRGPPPRGPPPRGPPPRGPPPRGAPFKAASSFHSIWSRWRSGASLIPTQAARTASARSGWQRPRPAATRYGIGVKMNLNWRRGRPRVDAPHFVPTQVPRRAGHRLEHLAEPLREGRRREAYLEDRLCPCGKQPVFSSEPQTDILFPHRPPRGAPPRGPPPGAPRGAPPRGAPPRGACAASKFYFTSSP